MSTAPYKRDIQIHSIDNLTFSFIYFNRMEPKTIKSNISGVQKILEILSSKSNVELSCFANMDENLCAVLGAFHKNGNTSFLIDTNAPSKFKRNLFIASLRSKSNLEYAIDKDVIPYFEIEKNDYNTQNKKLLHYIQHYILLTNHVPSISEQVKNLLQDAILEFFDNAFIHTDCKRVFACGKWNQSDKEFYLTIVNLGKTFQENVSEFFNSQISAEKAIEWAMVRGNTTKVKDTGGLGLSIITEFVEKNEGDFLLISGNGALCRHGKIPRYEKICSFFPGTFVNLVFNLSDPKRYTKNDENLSTVNFEW